MLAAPVVALALAVGLAGCSRAASSARSQAGAAVSQPPPTLSVAATLPPTPEEPVRVSWDRPVEVTVTGGLLRAVTVTDADGHPLAGVITPTGDRWASTDRPVPSTRYTLTADLGYGTKRQLRQVVSFGTSPAPHLLTATITPGDGAVVGVAMPITVQFNRAVPDRAAVQRALQVSATPAVPGAWHWMSSTEVHYRPQNYWPTGTSVSVRANLDRVFAGGDVWGSAGRSVSFTVGESHVSKVDVAAHTMTVLVNGSVARVLPISAGSPKYPSANGVHIVLDKTSEVIMDSQTVGIPRNSPDGYYEKVYWDVRISNGGAFVHAAPWSVGAQGSRNVSHGCVNLSPADGRWFYNLARVGDPVEVVNSGRRPDLSDAGTADWNLPWDAWLAGSAPPASGG